MDYWKTVLEEVTDKEHKNKGTFKFTDVGHTMIQKRIQQKRSQRRYSCRRKPNSCSYFIGDGYEGIYFTRREAQALYHLLKGKTMSETGRDLKLSPRTIEFYVKNMRLKLGVYSKDELIEKIKKTGLVERLDFDD